MEGNGGQWMADEGWWRAVRLDGGGGWHWDSVELRGGRWRVMEGSAGQCRGVEG